MPSESVGPKHRGFATSANEMSPGEDESYDTQMEDPGRKMEVRVKDERDRLLAVCPFYKQTSTRSVTTVTHVTHPQFLTVLDCFRRSILLKVISNGCSSRSRPKITQPPRSKRVHWRGTDSPYLKLDTAPCDTPTLYSFKVLLVPSLLMRCGQFWAEFHLS